RTTNPRRSLAVPQEPGWPPSVSCADMSAPVPSRRLLGERPMRGRASPGAHTRRVSLKRDTMAPDSSITEGRDVARTGLPTPRPSRQDEIECVSASDDAGGRVDGGWRCPLAGGSGVK